MYFEDEFLKGKVARLPHLFANKVSNFYSLFNFFYSQNWRNF